MFRTVVASFIAAAFLIQALPVQAQISGSPDPLTMTVAPRYPQPYQTVTITLGSTLIDLPSSELSITVDGVLVSEGRTAQVKAGGPGSSMKVVGKAVTSTGTYEKSVTISPAQVALSVEALTTAHPFYKGARLVAPESRVRIVALPDIRSANGTPIAKKDLAFTWKLGDQVLLDQSGLGKNVLVANAPVRYRDAEVSVTVTSKSGGISAQASAYISPADSFVRIYRNNPLSGLEYARALTGTFELSEEEETFRAVPYFFKDAPALTWSLNGTPSGTDRLVTVRASDGSRGTASLGVVARVPSTLEEARAMLNLKFGDNSTGIFGF